MWSRAIHFELLEILGEGGQGSVYKALRRDRATGLEQIVAAKILHSKTTVDLWRQEFESLSRVRSKYCVRVLSFERINRRPALILEYIDGVSLAQLGQTCWLDNEDIQELMAQLELALKDLHSHGLVHGDLSPQNILLDREGSLRLLDFGLANCSLLRPRVTPRFAAPERLCGEVTTPASDLFSLGRIEEFLRGHSVASNYLDSRPERRTFQDLKSCAAHQQALALKVNAFLERRLRNGNLKTRTQALAGPKAWSLKPFIVGTITSFMVLTTSSASQSAKPLAMGVLRVHTEHWLHLKLNGRELGYAPLSIALEAGQTYRLQWNSAKGHGEKVVHLEALEIRTMEDRDFSH